MADWLLGHQATLQSGLLIAAIVGMLVWETWVPRRAFAVPLGPRWFNQVSLTALGAIFVRFGAPIAAVALATLVQVEGWGLLNLVAVPSWVSIVLGLLAIDLGMYVQHRLFHAVPLLWRFHQIHHSDLDVDCGTALRHHPVETFVAQAFDLALIALVGVPAVAVLAGYTVAALVAIFNHANIMVPHAGERALRWFVVTPDMHRIHHSADSGEGNSNFANLLPWWDRLFSTYRPEPILGQTQMLVGLADARAAEDFSLWKLLALPFRHLRRGAYDEIRLGQPETSR